MRVTQGTFSFLPDLTDGQIEAQIAYALGRGWAILVEHTDDPHPRNAYWDLWGLPLFDLGPDQADVGMREVRACREARPDRYVKVGAYDRAPAGRRPRSASSSTGLRTSPASAWSARSGQTGACATR